LGHPADNQSYRVGAEMVHNVIPAPRFGTEGVEIPTGPKKWLTQDLDLPPSK